MRLVFAVLAGWIIYLLLSIILSALFTLIGNSNLIARYSGLPKEEIAKSFFQNPVDLLKFAFGLLLAVLTSVSIASFISGFIAHRRSILIGVLIAAIPSLIMTIGSILKTITSFEELFGVFLLGAVVLFIGGLFGLLGEKFYKRLNT